MKFWFIVIGGPILIAAIIIAARPRERSDYVAKLTSPTPVTDYTPEVQIGKYISADFKSRRWRPEVVQYPDALCCVPGYFSYRMLCTFNLDIPKTPRFLPLFARFSREEGNCRPRVLVAYSAFLEQIEA